MGKTLIWKFKFLLILFSASLLGCETSVYDPAEDAIKSTALIIEAIQLEDSLDNDKNKARYIYLMKEVLKVRKYVTRVSLNMRYKEWGDMFHDYLLKGAELTIEGDLESDPNISLQKLSQASKHINKYGNWWNKNRVKIAAKLETEKKEF